MESRKEHDTIGGGSIVFCIFICDKLFRYYECSFGVVKCRIGRREKRIYLYPTAPLLYLNSPGEVLSIILERDQSVEPFQDNNLVRQLRGDRP